MRTTVLGLLGSLPRHAFETTAIATGDALANLMFQLQMTGYMFKNAEYRLSLQSSMRASAALPPGTRLGYILLLNIGYDSTAVHDITSYDLTQMTALHTIRREDEKPQFKGRWCAWHKMLMSMCACFWRCSATLFALM